MRFLRFQKDGQVYQGYLSADDRVVQLEGDFFEDYKVSGVIYGLNEIKILPPCQPSKVICVGLNYRDHAREMGHQLPDEPVLFMKPPSSIIGHGEIIVYPEMSRQVDYEAELAVIIGKVAKNLSPHEVPAYIFGYTCANDVTARDLQSKDGQWIRAKSFDTFLPLGPYLITDIKNPNNLKIELKLNGETKQNSSTNQMIFTVENLVSFISQVMTLYPQDVIITGTPGGIGPMKPGDQVEVFIEKIGHLKNPLACTSP